MFAPPPLHVHRTPEQMARYAEVLASLRRLEEETRDSDDPVVFHGTSLMSASHIVADGFKPSYVQSGPHDPADLSFRKVEHSTGSSQGIHWGTLNVARAFAEKFSANYYDDHPVFLVARVSELMAVAKLYPDWFGINDASQPVQPYEDAEYEVVDDERNDWRSSLQGHGALVSVGASKFPGVQLINPFAGLPVHPKWQKARAERMFSRENWKHYHPHPSIVEDTAKTSPPTMTIEQADAQEKDHWDQYLGLGAYAAVEAEPLPTMG